MMENSLSQIASMKYKLRSALIYEVLLEGKRGSDEKEIKIFLKMIFPPEIYHSFFHFTETLAQLKNSFNSLLSYCLDTHNKWFLTLFFTRRQIQNGKCVVGENSKHIVFLVIVMLLFFPFN